MKQSGPAMYARTLGRIVVRSHAVWIVTGALAVLFGAFLLYSMRTGFIVETFQMALDSVHQSQIRNSDAPEYIQEEERLVASQLQDVVNSFGTKDFAASMATYYRTVADIVQTAFEEGRVDETADSILQNEGTAQLYEKVAQLANPVFYDDSTRFPLTYYTLYMLTQLPFFAWYIPLIIILGIYIHERENAKLLSHVPVSQPVLIFNLFLALFTASLACVLVAWLPAALWTLLNNGFGDPSYPVMFVTNGELFSLTVGEALLKWIAVFVGELALLSLIAAVCLSLNIGKAAQTAVVLLLALPFIPNYLSGTVPQFLLKYLPSTFLDEARITGIPGGAVTIIDSGPGCTFSAGMTTISGWCIAVILLALCACTAVGFMRIARLRRQHA